MHVRRPLRAIVAAVSRVFNANAPTSPSAPRGVEFLEPRILFATPVEHEGKEPRALTPVINEFVADHAGTDTKEFFEIFGLPSTDYSALRILQIEGDGGAGAGNIDSVTAVGTTNASGYWTSAYLSNVLENGTATYILVQNFTGAVGQDIDTNDDGIIDNFPWAARLDAVAKSDGGISDITYAAPYGPDLYPGFDGSASTVGGASRIPNGIDSNGLGDWRRNASNGQGIPGLAGGTVAATEAYNTPNAPNVSGSLSVSGTVFADQNQNGSQDPGETGLDAWSLYLDTNNNASRDATATTVASGALAVAIPDNTTVTSNLVVSGLSGNVQDVNITLDITHTFDSDLTVTLISPTGTRVLLFDLVGDDGDNFTATTLDDEAGQPIAAGIDPFTGTFRPQGLLFRVDGQVKNGTWKLEVTDNATGDTGTLNSWSLTFTDGEQTALTGPDGAYRFDGLAAGSYNVRQIIQPNYNLVAPPTGLRVATVSAGNPSTGNNFANFFTLATVSGTVFNDLDNDGVFDLAEPGLAGFTVFADANANASLDMGELSAITSNLGAYTLSGLAPGSYVIRQIARPGWAQTAPVGGTYPVTLTQGQVLTARDFGNRQLPGVISGIKFDDLNSNGIKDPTEPGLANFTLYLDTNNNGVFDLGEPSTITDATGAYSLSAPTLGTYVVAELPRANYTQTTPLGGASVGSAVNLSHRAGNETEAAIAIDRTNPSRLFTVSNIATGDGLVASYSTDAGKTWATRIMADGSDGLESACCDGTLSWDSYGNLFLGYINAAANKIVLVRSSNGGQSFTPVNTWTGSVDQPTVTTGPNSVFLSWNNTVANVSQMVVTGASVTGLGTVGAFSAIANIPGSTDGSFGDIAVGPTGQVLITYETPSDGEGPATLFANLDPDGLGPQPFGSAITITSTNVGGFDYITPQSGRSVDAEAGLAWDRSGGLHNGRVYLVYTDESPNESNNTDIYVRFSDNNGSTWSAPVKVNDDATTRAQFLPRIAIDQTTGYLAVSFHDARNDAGDFNYGDSDGIANDDAQFYAAVSTTFGASFGQNLHIAPGTSNAAAAANGIDYGDYTGLDFHAGNFFPAWADNSNSTLDNPDGALDGFDLYTARVNVIAPTAAGRYSVVAGPGLNATGLNFGNLPSTTLTGSAAADTWYVRKDATGNYVEVYEALTPTGSPAYVYSAATLASLTFTGLAGSDTLVVDLSNGNPVPAGSISFDGGANADTLRLIGSASADLVTESATQLSFASRSINFTSAESLRVELAAGDDTLTLTGAYPADTQYTPGPGNDILNVNAGTFALSTDPLASASNLTVNVNNAALTIPATVHLAALNLQAGALATLAPTGNINLVTRALALAPTATLDLANNALIVDYTGLSPRATLAALINSARNGYDANVVTNWNANGITSSTARTNSVAAGFDLYSIGIIDNSNLADPNIGRDTYTLFRTQTTDATTVLIRYTYAGDADLNGFVDGDDYALIDNAFNSLIPNFGWLSGDFNYDTLIDGDDYALIDSGFLFQEAPIF